MTKPTRKSYLCGRTLNLEVQVQQSIDPILPSSGHTRFTRRARRFVEEKLRDHVGLPFSTAQSAIDAELPDNRPGFRRAVQTALSELLPRPSRGKKAARSAFHLKQGILHAEA